MNKVMSVIKGLEGIWVGETNLLVTPLEDYYKNKNSSQFSTSDAEEYLYDVGVIEAVGEQGNAAAVGCVVFYHSHVSTMMKFPGVGERERFLNVTKEAVIAIRLDEYIFKEV